MVAYAHSHGIRVLQAAGCEGYTPNCSSWCCKLNDTAYRSQLVSQYNQSMRTGTLDGWGWDVEETVRNPPTPRHHFLSLPPSPPHPFRRARAQDPIYQPGVALFISELKQAYPELFHAFYIGNLVGKGGWLPWQATPMRAIAPVVDLVIV